MREEDPTKRQTREFTQKEAELKSGPQIDPWR
jgi:hypothetical protein